MNRKLLAVFAHPDDEAFGPGGTLAKYASTGVEINLLCATRGEAGLWDEKSRLETLTAQAGRNLKLEKEAKIHHVREEELLKSAAILGIKKVEFLDYIDGTLSNSIYHEIAGKIIKKIKEFQPQVLLTTERLGVSGHLDHIAISMITTYSYLHCQYKVNKLYYHCLPKERREKELDDYFVYFPEGYDQKDITTRIDFSDFWDKKEAATKCHQSQLHDVVRILRRWEGQPKVDHYILQLHQSVKINLPETDLFAGIGH